MNKKVQRLSLKNGLTLGSYDKKQSVVVWIYCRIEYRGALIDAGCGAE